MGRINSALLALALFAMLVGAARGEDSIINSDAVRAANIAYSDFERRLASRDDREGELAEYVLDPRNYDIGVSQTRDMYVVVFLLRKAPPYEYVIGGGGHYHLRKEDFTIVNFSGYK